MTKKKTMALNLTDKEMLVLASLASHKGLTKTGIMRQALRLYEAIHTPGSRVGVFTVNYDGSVCKMVTEWGV